MKKLSAFLFVLFCLISCSKENTNQSISQQLTIFFVNDQHGQIENFSKIKHIVDLERQETEVIVACSGDIFSGNPVVDNWEDKGFPIIDIMNRVGFDISVLGNHEFDYGEEILKKRMEQAEFEWVCANIDMGNTGLPEPPNFKSITTENLKVAFLGLIETNGKPNATIPSTHPWKVENFIFQRPENVVAQYSNIKEAQDADLYIALSHLGHTAFGGAMGDFQLAQQFPYFDLIIGGHTNQLLDTMVNNIPIFQAGVNLNHMGKIKLSIKDKSIESINYELIDLNTYSAFDADLKAIIDNYNADMSHLDEIIGFADVYHAPINVGCFYTDALREALNVDICIQNTGGIRSDLGEGPISKREIYEISPFNNGTLIYNMTVGEIKTFLKGSGSWFFYSGIQIEQVDSEINLLNENGQLLSDDMNLTLGINDYVPAVFDTYFPPNPSVQANTDAEMIIQYLENSSENVSYPDCTRYFRFQ